MVYKLGGRGLGYYADIPLTKGDLSTRDEVRSDATPGTVKICSELGASDTGFTAAKEFLDGQGAVVTQTGRKDSGGGLGSAIHVQDFLAAQGRPSPNSLHSSTRSCLDHPPPRKSAMHVEDFLNEQRNSNGKSRHWGNSKYVPSVESLIERTTSVMNERKRQRACNAALSSLADDDLIAFVSKRAKFLATSVDQGALADFEAAVLKIFSDIKKEGGPRRASVGLEGARTAESCEEAAEATRQDSSHSAIHIEEFLAGRPQSLVVSSSGDVGSEHDRLGGASGVPGYNLGDGADY